MQIQITGCMFENMGRNMNTKSKVIVLPCEAYDEERIYTLMKNGLSQLGGLDNLINKEEKILLKPNLLKKAEVEKAVITHPVVVGAFARILREEGYKNIVLADSCGHGTTKQVIQGTGMDTYLEKYQIPAIDYTKGVRVWKTGWCPGERIYPSERTAGSRVCDFSFQNENPRSGANYRSSEKQLWICIWEK